MFKRMRKIKNACAAAKDLYPGDALHTPSQNDVINAEQRHINAGRKARHGGQEFDPEKWCGIGISGGGIRASTFALGVMQKLAEKDLLKRFDYISTVSGGGYVGGALQWWWHLQREKLNGSGTTGLEPGDACGMGARDFPFRPGKTPAISADTTLSADQCAALRYAFLRQNGNFLTPGGGLNLWSGVLVVVRSLVACLLMLLPLLALAFLALEWIGAPIEAFAVVLNCVARDLTGTVRGFFSDIHITSPFYQGTILVAASLIAAFLFGILSTLVQSKKPKTSIKLNYLKYFNVFKWLILLAIFLIFMYIFTSSNIVIMIGFLISAFMFMHSIFVSFILDSTKSIDQEIGDNYKVRRKVEASFGRLFPFWVLLTAFGAIPLVFSLIAGPISDNGGSKILEMIKSVIYNAPGQSVTIFGIFSGVLSSLYGYYLKARNIDPSIAGSIFATLGAAIFLYFILLFGYFVGLNYYYIFFDSKSTQGYQPVVVALWITFGLCGVFFAFNASINEIGLHRFYRDRLMELFNPDWSSIRAGRVSFASGADTIDVSLLSRQGGDFPYPLINTNMVLSRLEDYPGGLRRGDNFMFSPLSVGSRSTGWESAAARRERGSSMSLPTAIAASGAAASANAGYLGKGVTTDSIVSSLMAVLNMRLGIWVRNPRHPVGLFGLSTPSYAFPVLSSVVGGSHRASSRFVELTDGGHFENLGVYELVRRKLSLILVVDGEADPTFGFPAFVSMCQRVREDFGARIVPDGAGLDDVRPSLPGGYPEGVKFAKQSYFTATLTYEDGTKGRMVYIKATLIAGLETAIVGYRASFHDFPHQSTADQFFSTDQFDAYVGLGRECAQQAISGYLSSHSF